MTLGARQGDAVEVSSDDPATVMAIAAGSPRSSTPDSALAEDNRARLVLTVLHMAQSGPSEG